MKAPVSVRRTLLALVATAALAAIQPGSIFAGGCEDPGYVGSNCSKKDSASFDPPIARPDPGKGKKERLSLAPDLESLRAWIAVFLSGVIR